MLDIKAAAELAAQSVTTHREDEDAEADEPKSDEEAPAEDAGVEGEQGGEEGREAQGAPPLKVKTHYFETPDGNKVEVPLTAKFRKKVDGQEVEFVLADALDELSGKHATKARMGALDGEKRKFDGYVRSVAEQARALNDAIKSGDPEKIAEAAAAFTGDDPDELMGGFYENVAPRLQEYYSLDEAERQAVDLERKGRAVKRKEERVKTREQTAEETTALQEHFRSLSKEYQLDTEGLRAGDDELSQLYQDGKLKGTRYAEVIEKVAKNTATLDEKREYLTYAAMAGANRRTRGYIEDAISKQSPDLKTKDPEAFGKVLQKAWYALQHPDPDERLALEEKALGAFIKKQLGAAAKAKPAAASVEDDDEVQALEDDDDEPSPPPARSRDTSNTTSLVPQGAWNPFAKH